MSFDLKKADNNIPLFSLDGTFCQCKVVDVMMVILVKWYFLYKINFIVGMLD